MMKNIGKCPICGYRPSNIDAMATHIEKNHSDVMFPDMSGYQFFYYLKTGKQHGTCPICKGNTTWNDKTLKYNKFCNNPKCKAKYVKIFRKNMIGKYGKITLLDSPEQQKKMLANRRISGKYVWSDGTVFTYTGSYERAFLIFLDVILNFDSSDIACPSPHVYYYIYNNKRHFYIPDIFIYSLNVEIEIKDGGDNPNMHHKIQAIDKVKEGLKDSVMISNKNNFNYIKIVNKEHKKFFDFLEESKKEFNNGKNQIIMI